MRIVPPLKFTAFSARLKAQAHPTPDFRDSLNGMSGARWIARSSLAVDLKI
jgi:hypothetical protein